MRLLKIKVVGDVSVGKTSFLRRWYLENFPDHEETHLFPGRKRTLPTVQDTFFTNITVDRESFVLTFWDTVCGADFQKLRPLEYEGTDIFLVFFDIANPSSFQNISTVWVPEVRHYMPVTPILVVGNKIDLRTASNAPDGLISVSKGQELADRLESHYCESSCATGEAVHNVIQTAVRLAIQNQSPTKKGFKVFQWQKKKPKIYRHGPNPPVLSPPGKMPQIKILPSTFTDDLRKMYRDAVGNNKWDIRFLFSLNNQPLLAHKIILCTGSSVFHDFFVNNEEDTELSQLLSCEDSFCSCCDSNRKESKNLLKKSNFKDRKGGNTQGLVSDLYRLEPNKLERKNKASYPYMERKMKGKLKSCLHLNNSVPEKAFDHVLEFLYTASPKVPSDAEDSFCAKVISLSQRLGIPSFCEMCENITNGEAYLNSSLISTVLEERKIAMEKFVNKPCFSDILFHVNNSVVHAHKAILMVRSEVMAAMFGGGFSEGDSKEVHIKGASTKSFLALLLFLYTDTLPKDMTVSDYRDLLVVADRFCHLQLISICEAAITEKIDTEIKKNRLDSTKCSEVINLLLTGQAHNAYQLARWCLYVISTNYTEFEDCDDFDLIKGDNLRHVLEHRWPPLAYLKELEEFKRKTGRA